MWSWTSVDNIFRCQTELMYFTGKKPLGWCLTKYKAAMLHFGWRGRALTGETGNIRDGQRQQDHRHLNFRLGDMRWRFCQCNAKVPVWIDGHFPQFKVTWWIWGGIRQTRGLVGSRRCFQLWWIRDREKVQNEHIPSFWHQRPKLQLPLWIYLSDSLWIFPGNWKYPSSCTIWILRPQVLSFCLVLASDKWSLFLLQFTDKGPVIFIIGLHEPHAFAPNIIFKLSLIISSAASARGEPRETDNKSRKCKKTNMMTPNYQMICVFEKIWREMSVFRIQGILCIF